ncbi:ABC transporter permease [Paenibacillus glycinis]|uniref:ABC transporter permease subunit n=1 Tax=Paenibacillus glycinis TaxID=2697035 RepID=A0ABW9XQN2_9BACL|nr:ABC transporter permease [Paenibacillus glycinis]NBD24689.1 ABC transporter permease subunit [Paenibacillus glycinis]
MNLLLSSTINEWTKLRSRKKTVFFLALIALLPFLGLPAVMKLQGGFGIAAIAGSDYPITVLNLLASFVLPLLIFMSAADMFSGEFGDKTIRSVLARPVSRFKIFFAKLIAAFSLVAAGLLLGWISSAIASFFLPHADGLPRALAESALAHAVTALPLFAICAAAVVVAMFFKHASGALAICILVYAAAKLLGFVLPQYAAWLPTAYMDWHELWIGSAATAGRIATVFSYLLGCGIVLSTLGYCAFDKKEV